MPVRALEEEEEELKKKTDFVNLLVCVYLLQPFCLILVFFFYLLSISFLLGRHRYLEFF